MSFDRLAPHYRWMEFVTAGAKLQRCRTAFLNEAASARQAIIFGVGRGRFLSEFLPLNPAAHVTCLDASSRMLELVRRQMHADCVPAKRFTLQHRDILNWSAPPDTYDLVVTHFFLDCFRPLQLSQIVRKIAQSATSRAKWLIADFREPPDGWLRFRACVMLRLMYLFFRAATDLSAERLTPPDSFLTENRFCLARRRISELGLLHSDVWEKRG